jgi:pimeloyl-ACP methyl ester carboxylesterase
MLAVILAQPDPVVLARPPAVSPAEFQAWFDKARAGQLTIPKEVERSARRYRYVFVAGFQNERMPGYFGQNARELRARGVPKRLIHFVTPDSNETVAGNAETVRSQLHEIAGKGPEEVVIIAHSRGACDALAFALENQDFLSDRVRAMFLLQGPFGGTGVADYLVGDGPALDGRMPWGTRVIVKALAALEGYALKQGKHGGLPAMATQSSEEFWEQLLREHTAAIPVVGPKTFYVTAQIAPRQLRLFKRAIAWYLESYFGPNDGMVALADQSVPGVGTVLAVLDAGHTDLTNQFPSAKPKRRMRKGLMDAIVMTVGDAGAVEVAKGE